MNLSVDVIADVIVAALVSGIDNVNVIDTVDDDKAPSAARTRSRLDRAPSLVDAR